MGVETKKRSKAIFSKALEQIIVHHILVFLHYSFIYGIQKTFVAL